MIILILNFVWLFIDELIGKGLEWSIVTELLTYTSMKMVPMALILGVLLASIMTYGNLGEHNELTAMKASGISLVRVMMPIGLIVVFLTLCLFV